jgi:hypothetical protein
MESNTTRQYVYFTDNIQNSWNKDCALLGYNAASSGNFLTTFEDNLSVPSSGGQESNKTSVRNSHYSLLNNPQDRSCQLLRGGSLKSHNGSNIWKGEYTIEFKFVKIECGERY